MLTQTCEPFHSGINQPNSKNNLNMKKTLLSGLLALSFSQAYATDYYLVVPVQGKTTNYSAIDVALASAALPNAQVGVTYSHDFKSHLLVTGDPSYTGFGVSWAAASGLPAGLALDTKTGVLSGVPTQAGSANIALTATYKSKAGQKAYQVLVTAPLGVLTADTSADFGNVAVSSTASRSFTFSNPGTAPNSGVSASLTGTGLSLTANTCGDVGNTVSVAAGSTCSMTVSYTPTANGALSGGALTVVSSAADSPTTITFAGMGQSAIFGVTGSPAATQNFNTTMVGSTATPTISINLRNTGNTAGTFAVPSFAGTNPGDFAQTTDCNNVAVNGTCKVTVTFTPTVAGVRSASLNLKGTTINFAGTGTAPLVWTTKLDFDNGNNSTAFVDQGNAPSTWSSFNGAKQSSALVQSGASSLALSGSSQGVTGPTLALSGNFTIQAWVRPTSLTGFIPMISQWNQSAGGGSWILGMTNGVPSFSFAAQSLNAALMIAPSAISVNQWTHIAVTRNGSLFSMYINGNAVTTANFSGAGTTPNVPVALGNYYGGTFGAAGATWFAGNIDGVYINANTSVYTGNFIPK